MASQLPNSGNKQVELYFKIKEGSFIGRLAAWKLKSDKVAIVIGKTIHLHNTGRPEFLENKQWLYHELKHVEQFKQHGGFLFLFLYLWESIRHGYTNNKYEVEARAAESDDFFISNTQPIEKRKGEFYY